MNEIIINTSPIYITIILGILFRKYKLLPKNASKTIGTIAFKIVVPFLVFNVLYGLKFTLDNINLLLISLFALIVTTLGSYLFARLLKLDNPTTGTVIISSMGFAIGSFAYPFIQANFENVVFQNVVLIDIVLFLAFLSAGYAIAVHYGNTQTSNKKIIYSLLYNPIIISILLTLSINYLNVFIPESILSLSTFFTKSFGFLAALLIGLSIRIPNVKGLFLIIKLFLFRNILLLALATATFRMLSFSEIEVGAILLSFLVPFSSMPIVFAEEQGLNTNLAAQLTLFSSIIMLFLYPLLIFILH